MKTEGKKRKSITSKKQKGQVCPLKQLRWCSILAFFSDKPEHVAAEEGTQEAQDSDTGGGAACARSWERRRVGCR